MNQTAFQTVLNNLHRVADSWEYEDNLLPTDADYLVYSPKPVGYNTTAEQRFLMQNLLVGFVGGSILDVGCGRCDLYGIANELALVNNDIIGYNAIDHNPIMTRIGEDKWGLTGVQVGAFETAELPTSEWVVASGLFTQRRCATETEDLQKLFQDIDILYNASSRVVSFNLMNPIGTTHHDGFFYVHPGLVMDMLIEKYQYVNIRANYAPDVYTVLIYKI